MGAIILYTAAFGLRHEPPVRFAEALARSGAVVMVPESAALRAGDIAPEEVDGLLKALAYLRARPDVDPARIGIFGFSAGGSIVLLTAETDVDAMRSPSSTSLAATSTPSSCSMKSLASR